ncbi:MAG: type II toxin-antitoxin system CcdA family antitoxin [Methanoregula sp.]|nr:type II toxin-antitoxin system CcdA family antitoxin [Methanoregula sp.]
MTGKKETGAPWQQTTVVLRSDIYRQALDRGIDISDACNRALAEAIGIDYRQQELESAQPAAPVIIARDGSLPPAPGDKKDLPSPALHPVINADDPKAPAHVTKVKKLVKKPVPEAPVPAAGGERPSASPDQSPKKPPVRREQKKPHGKGQRRDALRTFFSAKIARTDEAGPGVAKDELYERFARFCRDHHITPVPERKNVTIALKNRFALTEEMHNGIPLWAGIRLKD